MQDVLTFTWLVPILITVVGIVIGMLLNSIRENVRISFEQISETLHKLEKRVEDYINKIEKLDLDKRVAILEEREKLKV